MGLWRCGAHKEWRNHTTVLEEFISRTQDMVEEWCVPITWRRCLIGIFAAHSHALWQWNVQEEVYWQEKCNEMLVFVVRNYGRHLKQQLIIMQHGDKVR